MLNATACTSQPSGQAGQKKSKDLDKEVKGNTSEAVFHQAETLGKSKGSGKEPTSASMNGKQNSSVLPKDKKPSPSDSKIHGRKENDDPSLAVSHQRELASPVVMFNDSEKSLSGKIILRDCPSTVEAFKPAKGKFITEVNWGAFSVQVEINKSIFCKTAAQFPTKKRRPACHPRYSARHTRICYACKHCLPKCKASSEEALKPEVPREHEQNNARTESPSLKVSIVGKEIKVNYLSKKQNILINITHPQRRRKIIKPMYTSTNYSARAMASSSPQTCISHPGKQQLGSQLQYLGSSPSPPLVFAFPEKNSDTAAVALTSSPKRDRNKPPTHSPVSDNTQATSALSQQKGFKRNQGTPKKKHYSVAGALLENILPPSCDILRTASLSNTDLNKMPGEDRQDVHLESSSSSSSGVQETITSAWNAQPNTEGRDHSLNPVTSTPVPMQDDSYSASCSLSFQGKHLIGETAASICCTDSQTLPPEGCENTQPLSVPFSQDDAQCCTSFSPSPSLPRRLEPMETSGKTVSCTQCPEFMAEDEKGHGDMANQDMTSKTGTHSDMYGNAQQPLERRRSQSPTVRPAPSNSQGSPTPHSGHSTVESDQTDIQVHHLEMETPRTTEVPHVACRTDGAEHSAITQNDKEGTRGYNCPMGRRDPTESLRSLDMVEHTCRLFPVVKNKSHSEGEEPTQAKQIEGTAGSSCAVHVGEKLFLIEKTQTNGSGQCEDQNEKCLVLTTAHPGPAECQRTASVRPNSEEENNNDPKEMFYHHIDILLSPQEQKALKDNNLEISSLRKLSQELALKSGRGSDGSQEEAIDQWARRRQQFKDSKRCNSTGGSSFASNITEGSITSDDGHSVDFGSRVDIQDKGFYTENFHSAAWVFRGDDGNPEDSPRCLSKKPRPTAVRERTVRLFKGTGDYPWGFRIQFSKPIVVTEVDTNSAAAEAGLQIGDVVLSVNGTEVTCAEHAEAVHLARKGPDILTLVVGSDISRCPNTPWPACRGYLHKRTHTGFLKGWRKRWFVLKHDGYLQYYKHKKDEGKWPPLEVIKLEGAEVGIDSSLGKPFVFNCVPQSGSRMFCLCATSNQEMKRWLEAMDKAAHPIRESHVWEDVTAHNSNLPPLAIKNPECLGLLHRLDRSTDTWVQHYCIVKDGCLYFYASIRATQASGGLYLHGYSVSEQTHGFKQAVIELKPSSEEFRTFHFCAENETENQRWITALKASIKKWLPLHEAIQDFMNRPLEETRM
ncbi:uncharacterized protein LOC125339958 [Perognathus longimembris pacificus]|uniref:uncharacterized protein LOC125339958 n=1 Tax=Perognathus longimembris pacificus TaxID=214514 RepID=UPI00201A0452|nr:uncharacterized protein LOC125339958 [Perognathus longimembris pacificus]